jgi:hypothetical protein
MGIGRPEAWVHGEKAEIKRGGDRERFNVTVEEKRKS